MMISAVDRIATFIADADVLTDILEDVLRSFEDVSIHIITVTITKVTWCALIYKIKSSNGVLEINAESLILLVLQLACWISCNKHHINKIGLHNTKYQTVT